MRASALMRALVSEPPMPRFSIAVITAVLALAGLPAQAQSPNGALNVEIDRSARVQLRGAAASVIVANPQIADVTVVDANTLFIVGKGYGVTEVVAVDGVGRTLFQREIVVTGGSTGKGTSTRISPKKNIEPASRLSKRVCLPRQPKPDF
jgi:Flp pilus assembly secretin CpaC